MDPVVCGSCGACFPVHGLTEDDHRALDDQHYYQGLVEEWRMLLKVQAYYRRHPEAEGRIKPDFARLLASDDPEVREQLWAGVPFDQIDLPPQEALTESEVVGEEQEVVEYLRHHDFALGPRMEFVSQGIARLKGGVGKVACPRCTVGQLHVPPENRDEFTAADAITWYWTDWHAVDDDGTLHVKASGWRGGAHWTGEAAIGPDEPDYRFWRWFVAQEQYHRLVEEAELRAIKEEWLRRSQDCI